MKYLKTEEAASYLNCSVETIRRSVQKGELAASKFGKQYIFTEIDLDRFVESKKTKVLKPNRVY